MPEAVRKQCADVVGKLDRHVEALAQLEKGGPGGDEGLGDQLPGSEWCAPALEASAGRLRVASPLLRGSLLLLVRPLGGLAQGMHGWSTGERARAQICSDGASLHDRLYHICNTDLAAKEVARLLRANIVPTITHPQALLLCSPRAQLLPLLGQRSDSFFRSFATSTPSLLGGLLEEHRVALPSPLESCGLFPALALIPEADSEAANCEIRVQAGEALAAGGLLGGLSPTYTPL